MQPEVSQATAAGAFRSREVASLFAGLAAWICRVPTLSQPRQRRGAQSFLNRLLSQPISVSKKITTGFSQLVKKKD